MPASPDLLLIEDDDLEATLIGRWLTPQFEVHRVRTLAAAASALADPELRAVLLDLRLPDAQGIKALEAVVGRRSDLPVIVLTGLDQEKLGSRCVETGADDFLQKDALSADNLRRALGYALARRSADRFRLQLEHAQRLAVTGQLAAGVAHEVNNPATWVIGSLDLALLALPASLPEKSEIEEHLHRALAGMDRIREVVANLLRFARPETGDAERVDLSRLVEGSLQLVRKRVEEQAAVELELRKVPAIAAQPGGLSQVVVNLLFNAADAIRDRGRGRGRIRMETGVEGDTVFFSVSDDGCGMEPNVREQIFSPFYSTKDRRHGTGLGLSVSSQIVTAHRGWIDVHSTVGQGSRFVVRLPLDTGLVAGDEPPPPALDPSPGDRRLRILIVDDEPFLLATLERQLQSRYAVVTAEGGREAVEILSRDGAFDVVVSDLSMPDLDGPEILERSPEALRRRFLFLSGGAYTERLQSFVQENSDRLLMKPVSLRTLMAAIDTLADA